MNDQTIEQEIQAKALTAPRGTLADIEDNIDSEWYFNAGDAVIPDGFQPPVPALSPLYLLTLCVLILKNGFTVTDTSACVDVRNFNPETGKRISHSKARDKVFHVLAFAYCDEHHGDQA